MPERLHDDTIPPDRKPRVAILGGGPIGLEAAAALADRGYRVVVYEAGQVADSVRRWGHVRLFSPWRMNRSGLGARLVAEAAPALPSPDPDACPTGAEFVAAYLEPLARSRLLRDCVREGCRVIAASRSGLLRAERVGDPDRASHPFRVLIEEGGSERIEAADVILDATGTYRNPAPTGDGGIPAPGEAAAASAPEGRLVRHLEEFAGAARAYYAGERVLVVGAGYSAATAVRELGRLAAEAPGTQVTWALRGALPPLPEIPADPLPEREALARDANRLAAVPPPGFTLLPGHSVERFEADPGGLTVTLRGREGLRRERFGRVVSLTGYGPDSSIYRGLQVHECYATRGPMKLAALLAGEGSGDCLALPETGPEALRSPEPGFFILGAKSYGTNSAFLLRNGLAQVRDLAGLLAAEVPLRKTTGSAGS